MKLVIVNDAGIFGGGAESRIQTLVNELLRTKFFEEIHLIEHKSSKSVCNEIKIHKADKQTSSRIFKDIAGSKGFLLQVHNLALLGTEIISCAHQMSIPVIFSAHDYWGFCGRRNLIDWKNRSCSGPGILKCSRCIGLPSFVHTLKNKNALNKCSVGISPSAFVKKLYESAGVLKGKWKTIPPWIDPLFFSQKESGKREKSILFVSGLAAYKGIDLTVRAAEKVFKQNPDATLRIAGPEQEENNPNRERIDALARKLNITDKVIFLGTINRESLMKEYCRAGVCVFSPVWPEPSALSVQEAMACNCPVVATASGGLPEVIGRHGITVQENVLQLSDAINKILGDKELADSLGKKAKIYAQKTFNVSRAVEDLKKVYYQISS